jgi:signal recognition particle subunit SRP54
LTFKTPNCSFLELSANSYVFAVLLEIRVSTLVSEGSPTSAISVGCIKMFENLTNKLENIFSKLKSAPSLGEEQVDSGLKEIRQALLEADVALPVVKEFISNIKPKAIGQEIIRSTSPGQMIVKLVHDEMVGILGFKNEELNLSSIPPVSLLLVGLQGSGKTTSAAKLGKLIEKNFKKKVMLVSLDVYRPAAQEQLKILGEKNNITNLPIIEKQQPIDITKRAMTAANLNGSDVIIFDTAGRTQIDLPMMSEIKQIKEIINPSETILVADSLTGQIAANVAKEFDAAVNLSSIILTRVDGDGRGGAALSMKQVTGKPIKYIGVGEKITDFELFHPDRIANRILGMGDVVSLVEKAAQDLDEDKVKKAEEELKKGVFTMDTYLSQLRQMKKMGGMEGVMSLLPGVSKIKSQMNDSSIDERMIVENEAVILSMTTQEKENPKIISGSRRKRIAQGSGVDVSKINRLLKQFKMMSEMMKKMSQGKKIPSGVIPDEIINQIK